MQPDLRYLFDLSPADSDGGRLGGSRRALAMIYSRAEAFGGPAEDESRLPQAVVSGAPSAQIGEAPCMPGQPVAPPDIEAVLAEIDRLRGLAAQSQQEPLEALMFLGQAKRSVSDIADDCQVLGLHAAARAADLLERCLGAAEPLNHRHTELILLLFEALRALFKLGREEGVAQQAASEDLLAALNRAAQRHIGPA